METKFSSVQSQALEELSETLQAHAEETYEHVKAVCEHFFEQNEENEKQLSNRRYQVLGSEYGKELCTIDEDELRALLER